MTIGEHYFDYVQIFCNEDLAKLAYAPVRLNQQLEITCKAAVLSPIRLLQWITAYTALSAAWFVEDNDPFKASHQLQVAELALAKLP